MNQFLRERHVHEAILVVVLLGVAFGGDAAATSHDVRDACFPLGAPTAEARRVQLLLVPVTH